MSNLKVAFQAKNFLYLIFSFCFLFAIFNLGRGICNNSSLNLDKLKVYFLEGDYKQSITEGEKLLAEEQNSANSDELYYILGLSYLKDGNYLRASDIFEIVLNEFKNSRFREEAELGLGDTYFLRGDITKAQGSYLDLIKENPNTKFKPQLYYRLSQIGFKNGFAEQGKQYLELLKKEYPSNIESALNKDLYALADSGSELFYTVQVGFFSNITNAENLKQRLIQNNYQVYLEEASSADKRSYRVRVGKLRTRQEAIELENKLIQEGFPTKIFP